MPAPRQPRPLAALRRTAFAAAVLAVIAPLAFPAAARAQQVAPPGAVAGLEAGPSAADAIWLRWDAPADGGPAEGYEVERAGDGGGDWSALASVGAAIPAHRDAGLTAGGAYRYRVRAFNAAGAGAWSETASAAPAARPGRVADLAVAGADAASLTLRWSAPPDGGAPILRYDVQRLFGVEVVYVVGGWAHESWPDGEREHAFEVGRPFDGIGRSYRVRAWNAAGPGGWSAPTPPVEAAAPAAPPRPEVAAVDPDAVALRWAAPGDGGAPIFVYEVQRRHGIDDLTGVDYWTTAAWALPFEPAAGVAEALRGRARTYRVRAWNAVGDGEWSRRSLLGPGLAAFGGSFGEFRALLAAECRGDAEVHGTAPRGGEGVLLPYSTTADEADNAAFEAAFADGFDRAPLFVSRCAGPAYLGDPPRGGVALVLFTGSLDRLREGLEAQCDPGAVAWATPRAGGGAFVPYSAVPDADRSAFEAAYPFGRLWREPLLLSGCRP